MAKYRYKKDVGKHYVYDKEIKGQRMLEPGEIVDSEEHDISGALDKFELVSSRRAPAGLPDDDLDAGKDAGDDGPVSLKAVHKGGGRYDVVNAATNEKINDGYLNKEQAAQLVDGNKVEED